MQNTRVSYGYLESWGDSDAVLFLADAAGLEAFANLLRHLAKAHDPASFVPLSEPLFEPRRRTTVTVSIDSDAVSRADRTSLGNDAQIVWRLSPMDAIESANMLDALVASGKSAHQYLEKSGDIQIIASIGEYSPNLFNSSDGTVGR